ncbi:hypothetical protein TNCV_2455151 [Trichonephila clavipes]|nr:hypothetical protein TNCV_2455151 [Trichonephila clavipes]
MSFVGLDLTMSDKWHEQQQQRTSLMPLLLVIRLCGGLQSSEYSTVVLDVPRYVFAGYSAQFNMGCIVENCFTPISVIPRRMHSRCTWQCTTKMSSQRMSLHSLSHLWRVIEIPMTCRFVDNHASGSVSFG